MADEGKLAQRIKAWRARSPFFDHVMAMNEHYNGVQGNVLAGAVTYFGFLSFFPILALGFAVVGFVSIAYPDARDSMTTAIQQVLPGIVSSRRIVRDHQPRADRGRQGRRRDHRLRRCSVQRLGVGVRAAGGPRERSSTCRRARSGTSWSARPIDLVALACIGVILIASVAVAGVVKGAADDILETVGLADSTVGTPLIWAVGVVLGLAASTVLFYVMFRLLGHPDHRSRPLWQGAFLGAAGFEVLKVLVVNVFGSVGGSAFAPLAIAITLVVWINYFSRLVVYGASWAMTDPSSRAARTQVTPEMAASAAKRARAGGCARGRTRQPAARTASTPAAPCSAPWPASLPPTSSAATSNRSAARLPPGRARKNGVVIRPRPRRPDIEAAAFRIGSGIRRTPVLTLSPDETGLPGNVVLKLELFQHTGSFKARGALNSVLSLSSGLEGVCAASGGNHAAAVAWAARRAGLAADVFVPSHATPAKIARVGDYGGRIHLVEGFVKDALEACTAFSEEHVLPLLHPYDTFETVSGAGTLGLEIEEQVPEAERIVVACGGGGLYAGLANALEGIVHVQPVEPTLCPDLANALAAGHPVETEVGGVAVDSLGAPHIGEIALATAQENGVLPVLVEEDDIVAARRFLWDRLRVLAEPGACVAMAAVLTRRVEVVAGETVVVIVSGGNNETLPG